MDNEDNDVMSNVSCESISSSYSSLSDFDSSPNSVNIDVNYGLGTPLDKTKLTILHFNICSLLAENRLEELEETVNKLEVDILALTETHLDHNVPNSIIALKNFHEPIRNDRIINGRHGGGCAIYIRQHLAFQHKSTLQSKQFENIWVDVFCNGKKVVINCLYRPPNTDNHDLFLQTSSTILNNLSNYNADTKVILGDLNFGNIYCSYPTLEPKPLDFLAPDTFTEYGFSQLIDIPTRITDTSTSLLDLIFVDKTNQVLMHGTLPKIADHDGTLVTLNIERPKITSESKQTFDYKNVDISKLESYLMNCNFNEIVFSNPIENQADIFSNFLKKVIADFVPVKYIKVHSNDQPWTTKLTKLLLRKKNRNYLMYKKANESYLKNLNNPNISEETITRLQCKLDQKLRKARYAANESTKANRRAKLNFYNSVKAILHNKDVPAKKKFSILIKLMKNNKHSPMPPLVENEKVINDPLEKANIFNAHFSSKSHLDGANEPCSPLLRNPDIPDFDNINTSPLEVKYFIKRLKKSHVSHCGISGKFLQLIAKQISAPLARLFNNLFSIGHFPSVWKIGQVTPVYKRNGSKVDKNNYRPISILPSLSKVYESIIHARLLDHCSDHDIISHRQAAYLKGDSTITQLIYLVHKIKMSWGEGKITQCAFLDISAAFDKVYHNGLITKLEQIGITGTYIELFKSYLNGRRQRVAVEGKVSDEAEVHAGVPQGSRLGPLLFIIYIEDITKDLESEILLFADDTTLFAAGTDPFETSMIINRDLEKINNWAKKWKVTFNAKKSQDVIFSSKVLHNSPPLMLNNTVIERVVSHKHLGIYLTQNLDWSLQVHEICLKASRKLYVLRSIKFLDRQTLDMLYKLTVRSVLDYGLPLYGNNLRVTELKRFENIQYRAAKVVTGALHLTSKESLDKELGWESIKTRCDFLGLSIFHKIHSRGTRPLIRTCLPSPCLNERYPNRHTGGYQNYVYKGMSFAKSFFPYFSSLWSKLPKESRKLPLTEFKQFLKTYLKPPRIKHFNAGSKEGNLLMTRIRLKRSLLFSDLFRIGKHDSPLCLGCNKAETGKHFLTDCKKFTDERKILYEKVTQLFQTFLNVSKTKQYDILINGINNENPEYYKLNKSIALLVQTFIFKTKRFSNV